MSSINYLDILSYLFPDGNWSIVNNDYETITIYSDDEKPSKAEMDAAWPYVQYERAREQVYFARHAAYAAPDGPDAIFLQWQRGDATEQDWLDAVQAVKEAHPYPPQPDA